MFVDLIAEFFGHSRYGERVFHPAVVGVGGREEVFVGMYSVIVVQFVAKVLAELGEKAVGDES
jgi:hypothetical protein